MLRPIADKIAEIEDRLGMQPSYRGHDEKDVVERLAAVYRRSLRSNDSTGTPRNTAWERIVLGNIKKCTSKRLYQVATTILMDIIDNMSETEQEGPPLWNKIIDLKEHKEGRGFLGWWRAKPPPSNPAFAAEDSRVVEFMQDALTSEEPLLELAQVIGRKIEREDQTPLLRFAVLANTLRLRKHECAIWDVGDEQEVLYWKALLGKIIDVYYYRDNKGASQTERVEGFQQSIRSVSLEFSGWVAQCRKVFTTNLSEAKPDLITHIDRTLPGFEMMTKQGIVNGMCTRMSQNPDNIVFLLMVTTFAIAIVSGKSTHAREEKDLLEKLHSLRFLNISVSTEDQHEATKRASYRLEYTEAKNNSAVIMEKVGKKDLFQAALYLLTRKVVCTPYYPLFARHFERTPEIWKALLKRAEVRQIGITEFDDVKNAFRNEHLYTFLTELLGKEDDIIELTLYAEHISNMDQSASNEDLRTSMSTFRTIMAVLTNCNDVRLRREDIIPDEADTFHNWETTSRQAVRNVDKAWKPHMDISNQLRMEKHADVLREPVTKFVDAILGGVRA